MSDEDDCRHGMDPAWCVLCNGRAALEKKAEEALPRIFPAKYEGHCGQCNLPIYVGESIAWREGLPAIHSKCWERRK